MSKFVVYLGASVDAWGDWEVEADSPAAAQRMVEKRLRETDDLPSMEFGDFYDVSVTEVQSRDE